jgi:hypothetical protein
MNRLSVVVGTGLWALLGTGLYAFDLTPTPSEPAAQPTPIAANDSPTAQVQAEPVGDYDAREWGVIFRNRLLGRDPVRKVKEPVIYFTSRDKKDFSLRVTFENGSPTAQYPKGDVSGSSVSWEHVSFSAPNPATDSPSYSFGTMGTLADLNNVQADPISVGGVTSHFLFYEGRISGDEPLKVAFSKDNMEVHLENASQHEVEDIIISFRDREGNVRQAVVDHLDGGASDNRTLKSVSDRGEFPDLTRLGFKSDENQAFEHFWAPVQFRVGEVFGLRNRNDKPMPVRSVIYRLSREACDEVARLDFEPKPKKLTRALYVFDVY